MLCIHDAERRATLVPRVPKRELGNERMNPEEIETGILSLVVLTRYAVPLSV